MCWSSLVELCMSIQCRVYLQCSYLQVIIIIKVYFPWAYGSNLFGGAQYSLPEQANWTLIFFGGGGGGGSPKIFFRTHQKTFFPDLSENFP
jgi:hypothetical protein